MNLTDCTDILDHLEANGNVPVWYNRRVCHNDWVFRGCPVAKMKDDIDLATASLCYTIEDVLAKSDMMTKVYWNHQLKNGSGAWVVSSQSGIGLSVTDPDRLAAAAAAYRTHFGLENLC